MHEKELPPTPPTRNGFARKLAFQPQGCRAGYVFIPRATSRCDLLRREKHLAFEALHVAERKRVGGRRPDASAAIMDSQSAKTAEEGGEPNGYDPHKKAKSRKRHLLVESLSFPPSVYVIPADVQDRGTLPARRTRIAGASLEADPGRRAARRQRPTTLLIVPGPRRCRRSKLRRHPNLYSALSK